jgi:SAM-dependent methyltransferase
MESSEPGAAERWAAWLHEWAIPGEILAAAPESPWWFPVETFTDYARVASERPWTATHRRAAEALPEGGVLLDVGAGAGAASLPLAPPAGRIVAVDEQAKMLAAASELLAGRVPIDLVEGSWPDAAARAGGSDVTVCANVLYNVADEIVAFVEALATSARRRVIVELTEVHPMSLLSPLWHHFWGLERPSRPTAADAVEVVKEVTRAEVSSESWDLDTPYLGEGSTEPGAVARIRRRLCLPATADGEIARLLDDLPDSGAARAVTLWWDCDTR